MIDSTSFQETCSLKEKPKKVYRLWTIEQDSLYLKFMEQHRNLFRDEATRRSNRVFKTMAEYLPTRDCDQCRSHHQKMILKFKSVGRLIKHLKNKIEPRKKGTLIYAEEQKTSAKEPLSLISSSDTLGEQLSQIPGELPWEAYINDIDIQLQGRIPENPVSWIFDDSIQF